MSGFVLSTEMMRKNTSSLPSFPSVNVKHTGLDKALVAAAEEERKGGIATLSPLLQTLRARVFQALTVIILICLLSTRPGPGESHPFSRGHLFWDSCLAFLG